jgi:3-hydroxyisobutyrate dehydrogenase-like beta-hydroxyacid dehydrogenase
MRVAVVGLGLMGEAIARRLLEAGHELTVWNRTAGRAGELAAAGARVAGAPAQVWENTEVCFTMVADDTALTAVTLGRNGLLTTADRVGSRVLIDMSTVSPRVSRAVAEAAERVDVAFLRAPVTGNPSVVRAGNLGIMISGVRSVFERLEEVLQAIGPNIFYVGGGEEARVLKLALNVVLAGTTELLAEALVLGEAAGLGRAALLEVMGASAVGSPFVKYKTEALVAQDYTATFTAAAMLKDVTLALDAAGDLGVPLPATRLVESLLRECVERELGDADLTALVPRLEHEASR